MLSGLSDGAVTTRMRPVTRDAHLSFVGVRVAMPRPAHTSLDLGILAHAVEARSDDDSMPRSQLPGLLL